MPREYRVNPDDLTSYEVCVECAETLLQSCRARQTDPYAPFNEPWAKSAIRALMLKAHCYMLVTEYEQLVDHVLFPTSQLLSDPYRQGFDIAILLHQMSVARDSWTILERGWRRLRVAEIALRDGKENCGQDPMRHLSGAIRRARQCCYDEGGMDLVDAIAEVCTQYGLSFQLEQP